MKRRHAEFLYDPTMLRLRNELAKVCKQAVEIARTSERARKNGIYDTDAEGYTQLLFKRENILRDIEDYWNRKS